MPFIPGIGWTGTPAGEWTPTPKQRQVMMTVLRKQFGLTPNEARTLIDGGGRGTGWDIGGSFDLEAKGFVYPSHSHGGYGVSGGMTNLGRAALLYAMRVAKVERHPYTRTASFDIW